MKDGVDMGKIGAVSAADDRPPLDRFRADDVLEPDLELWGIKAIADCLGVAENTVRRWAHDPASGLPVSKPMGRWFARRKALRAWRQAR